MVGVWNVAGSILSSVLAWIAKLRWSKEFASAKDETIKSKDAQIAMLEREIKSVRDSKEEIIKVREAQIVVIERENATLKLFSSDKLKESYISVKNQLEEQLLESLLLIENLEREGDRLDSSIGQTTSYINRLTEAIRIGTENIRSRKLFNQPSEPKALIESSEM